MTRLVLTHVIVTTLFTAVQTFAQPANRSYVSPPSQTFWKQPVSSWRHEQVVTFLENSPWAGKGRIGYKGSKPNATATVAWGSASLVKDAFTRYYSQRKGWNGFLPHLDRMLTRPIPTYIVTVKLSDMSLDTETENAKRSLREMQADTQLLRKGRPPVKAVDVDSWNDYNESLGMFSLVVVYGFPASDPITLTEDEVTFSTKACLGRGGTAKALANKVCPHDITKTFRLKDMVIEGQLTL